MEQLIVCFAILLVGLAAIGYQSARHERHIIENFPPITDEEFLARCKPGTNPEIALKVRKIVANQMGVEYERVHPSTRFIGDLS
jgi:hypothetical protein